MSTATTTRTAADRIGTHDAQRRHPCDVRQVIEPVALGVIGLSRQDRSDEAREQVGCHLAVAVDLHDDRRASGNRRTVTRHYRPANTLVLRMADNLHSRIAALGFDPVP